MDLDTIIERALRNLRGLCPDCGEPLRVGSYPFPCRGQGHNVAPRDAAIHASEQVVVWRNPATGETRIPGRADRAIHIKYQQAGFTERVSLTTHSQIRQLEREKGLVHEPSHFDLGSATAERETNSV